jgi:ProP effector
MSTIADKKRRYTESVAGIALLAEKYPRTFFTPEHRRKPLKIGIRQDIIADGFGALTPPDLANTLRVYCRNRRYLERLRPNAMRIDLNGDGAGFVNSVDAKRATDELARGLLKAAARREASSGTFIAYTNVRTAEAPRAR